MSKLVFERTGAALWAQGNVLGCSCMVLLWHVNLQRDKNQGSTSDRCLPPDQRSVRLSREKEIVAMGAGSRPRTFYPTGFLSAPILLPSTNKKCLTGFLKWIGMCMPNTI